jgi:hypothetical protein
MYVDEAGEGVPPPSFETDPIKSNKLLLIAIIRLTFDNYWCYATCDETGGAGNSHHGYFEYCA